MRKYKKITVAELEEDIDYEQALRNTTVVFWLPKPQSKKFYRMQHLLQCIEKIENESAIRLSVKMLVADLDKLSHQHRGMLHTWEDTNTILVDSKGLSKKMFLHELDDKIQRKERQLLESL